MHARPNPKRTPETQFCPSVCLTNVHSCSLAHTTESPDRISPFTRPFSSDSFHILPWQEGPIPI